MQALPGIKQLLSDDLFEAQQQRSQQPHQVLRHSPSPPPSRAFSSHPHLLSSPHFRARPSTSPRYAAQPLATSSHHPQPRQANYPYAPAYRDHYPPRPPQLHPQPHPSISARSKNSASFRYPSVQRSSPLNTAAVGSLSDHNHSRQTGSSAWTASAPSETDPGRHMRAHTRVPAPTEEDQDQLEDEENQGAGGELRRKHACPICNKSFNRPSSLRIHQLTHTGDKPFVCPHSGCGRAFNVLSNMRRHYRNHSRESVEASPTELPSLGNIDSPLAPGHHQSETDPCRAYTVAPDAYVDRAELVLAHVRRAEAQVHASAGSPPPLVSAYAPVHPRYPSPSAASQIHEAQHLFPQHLQIHALPHHHPSTYRYHPEDGHYAYSPNPPLDSYQVYATRMADSRREMEYENEARRLRLYQFGRNPEGHVPLRGPGVGTERSNERVEAWSRAYHGAKSPQRVINGADETHTPLKRKRSFDVDENREYSRNEYRARQENAKRSPYALVRATSYARFESDDAYENENEFERQVESEDHSYSPPPATLVERHPFLRSQGLVKEGHNRNSSTASAATTSTSTDAPPSLGGASVDSGFVDVTQPRGRGRESEESEDTCVSERERSGSVGWEAGADQGQGVGEECSRSPRFHHLPSTGKLKEKEGFQDQTASHIPSHPQAQAQSESKGDVKVKVEEPDHVGAGVGVSTTTPGTAPPPPYKVYTYPPPPAPATTEESRDRETRLRKRRRVY